MKSKKLIAIFTAIITCTTIFAGCGSGAKDTSKKSSGTQTVKMWFKGSGTDPAIQAVIDKFNKSQKEVSVKAESYGENYANVVNMSLSSGDAPDIFEIGDSFSPITLAKQGLIAPLDDVITSDIKSKINPAALKEKSYIYKGKLYSIATRISTYRLLYNKDLFKTAGLDPEKPPTTLEELREDAKKITESGKGKVYGYGIYCGSSNIWQRILDPVSIAAGQSGPFGYDYNKGQYDVSKQKSILQFYINLTKDGSVFPGYETLAVDQVRANFAKGNIAMYIDGNWTSGTYATQIKTNIDWDTAAIPVPQDTTYGKGYAFPGVNYAVSKSSKHQDAAKKFLTFLLKNGQLENQYKPEPKAYTPANNISALPVKALSLKGYKVNFKTDDLASLPFDVSPFLKIEGDNRDKVFTNDFIKSVKGNSVDLDKDMEDLNTRYNKALNDAINNGDINKKDITISGYDMNKRK